jgi:hypothetical protein
MRRDIYGFELWANRCIGAPDEIDYCFAESKEAAVAQMREKHRSWATWIRITEVSGTRQQWSTIRPIWPYGLVPWTKRHRATRADAVLMTPEMAAEVAQRNLRPSAKERRNNHERLRRTLATRAKLMAARERAIWAEQTRLGDQSETAFGQDFSWSTNELPLNSELAAITEKSSAA